MATRRHILHRTAAALLVVAGAPWGSLHAAAALTDTAHAAAAAAAPATASPLASTAGPPPRPAASPHDEPLELALLGQAGGTPAATATSGNVLFTGIGPRLAVLDLAGGGPDGPLRLLRLTAPLPGIVSGLALDPGRRLFVATATTRSSGADDPANHLLVYDARRPALLALLQDVPLPFVPGGIVVSDDFLVVAAIVAQATDLHFWPLDAEFIPGTEPTLRLPVQRAPLATHAGLIYALDAILGELHVVDVATAKAVTKVAAGGLVGATGLVVDGENLYVSGGSVLFNLTDPRSPRPIRLRMHPTLDWPAAPASTVRDGILYEARGSDFWATDIRDPDQPRFLTHMGVPWPVVPASRVAAGTTSVFALGNGVAAVETLSPDAMSSAGIVGLPASATHVAAGDGAAYLTADGKYVWAARGARSLDGRPASFAWTAATGNTGLGPLAAEGDHGIVLDVAGVPPGLWTLNLTDPLRPEVLVHRTFQPPAGSPSPVVVLTDAFLEDGWAFIASQSGVYIMDVADPAEPRSLGRLAVGAEAVAARGGMVFLATPNDFRIFDVADPASPQPLGVLDGAGAEDVALAGDMAFLLGNPRGLAVLRAVDVADTGAPRSLATVRVPRPGGLAAAIGPDGSPVAFVASGRRIRVFQVVDLAKLTEVASTVLPAEVQDLSWRDGRLFAAAGPAGLYELGWGNPTQPYRLLLPVLVRGSWPTARRATQPAAPRHCTALAQAAPGIRRLGALGGRGRAIAVGDTIAYVGAGSSVWAFNVSDPFNPRRLVVETSAGPRAVQSADLGAPIEDIIDFCNLLYVAVGAEGVAVLVLDGSNLREVARIPTAGRAVDLTRYGPHLLVAEAEAGVRIVDVSTPTRPRTVALLGDLAPAWAVAAYGDRAAIATGRGVFLADLAQLPDLDVKGPLVTPGMPGAIGFTSHGCESGLYVADTAGLHWVDCRDPANMTIRASALRTMAPRVLVVWSDGAFRDSVYVVDTGPAPPDDSPSIRVFERQGEVLTETLGPGDPETPWRSMEEGVLDIVVAPEVLLAATDRGMAIMNRIGPMATYAGADTVVDGNAIAATDGRLYVATYGGLRIADVESPRSPRDVALAYTGGSIKTPHAIEVVDDVAFVASVDPQDGSEWRAAALDVGEPSDPDSWRATFLPETDGSRFLARVGNLLFVGASGVNSGVRVFDISRPREPVLVGGHTSGPGSIDRVAAGGTLVALDTSSGCDARDQPDILLVDVSDPAAPHLAGTWRFPSSAYGYISGLAVVGTHLYALTIDCGLRLAAPRSTLSIVDLADPGAPALVGTLSLAGLARDLIVRQDLAFAALHADGWAAMDVSDPTAPRLVDRIPAAGTVAALAEDRGQLYVLDSDSSVDIYRVDDLVPAPAARLYVPAADAGSGSVRCD